MFLNRLLGGKVKWVKGKGLAFPFSLSPVSPFTPSPDYDQASSYYFIHSQIRGINH